MGAFVGNITADAGLSSQYTTPVLRVLHFSFLEQPSSYEDLFRLDRSTGVLWADKVINRETICAYKVDCVIPLDVQVQPPEYFQIIKVEVVIVDLNDNTPLFQEQIIVRHLTEASTVDTPVTIPIADDPDSPAFGIQQYQIISGSSKFELREGNYQEGAEDIHLILKERLDREQQDLYTIQVVAFDGGTPPKSGTTTVNIVVLDVNDNNPQFDQLMYEVTVDEKVPEMSTIVTVSAIDPDEGLNGEVIYGFSSKTEAAYGTLFMIMEESGEIIVIGDLDYEQGETYTLVVTAKDKNPNSVPARAKVIISVLDLNDHPPVIKINTQTRSGDLEVSEFAINNTFVAHITVTDPDSNVNGEFDCSLSDPRFALTRMYSTEFKIVAMTTFDREVQALYEVTLVCEDRGVVPQATEMQLKIRVIDENDFSPEFPKSLYTTAILENNVIGASIITVSAGDRDQGDNANITYQIADNMKDVFHVEPVSGVVSAQIIFDREQVDKINFTVLAIDQGSPAFTGTATVLVSIMDKDDEIPAFGQDTYEFSVVENEIPRQVVGTVTAVDRDLPPFNRFIYGLDINSAPEVTEQFYIDSKLGVIFTQIDFDREQRNSYTFQVMAVSSSLRPSTSYATVNVLITDKNDNYPIVEFPHHVNNTVYVDVANPDIKPGFVFTTVVASDADILENAVLNFSIIQITIDETEEQRHTFSIDSETGDVAIAKDAADITVGDFEALIKVADNGQPPMWAEATLKVSVFDSTVTGFDGSQNARRNLHILVSIVVVCSIVATILVLAIVYNMRRRKKEVKKYKWVAEIKAAQPPLQNYKLNHEDKQSILPVSGQSSGNNSPTDEEKCRVLYTNQNGLVNTALTSAADDTDHNTQPLHIAVGANVQVR